PDAARKALDDFDYRALAACYVEGQQAKDVLPLLVLDVTNYQDKSHPWVIFELFRPLAGDPRLVAALLKAAGELRAKDPDALGDPGDQLLAFLASSAGDHDTAIACLRRRLSARPSDNLVRWGLALELMRAWRCGQAAEQLEALIQQLGDQAPALDYQRSEDHTSELQSR